MEKHPQVFTMQKVFYQPGALHLDSLCIKRNMIKADYPLHIHDHYEIELVTEGRGIQWLNGNQILLSKGSFYMLSPKDIHRFETNSPLQLITIKVFDHGLSMELQELLGHVRGGAAAQLSEDDYKQILQIFLNIQKEIEQHGSFCTLRVYAYLTLLLTWILTVSHKLIVTPESKPIMNYIRTALDYIQSNYCANLTLPDVAGACSLSVCYFSSIFKQYVGCGFARYLTDLRLQHAQSLLAGTSLPVTEIAYASGFGSLSNFLRSFNRQVGSTPSAYRLEQNALGV
jgi:AraC-like DNA-binding protein